jgi:hypothetical protein
VYFLDLRNGPSERSRPAKAAIDGTWAPLAQSGTDPDYYGLHLIVERTTVTIPRDQYEAIEHERQEIASMADRAHDQAIDALSESISAKITERGWNEVSECWVTRDPAYFGSAVQGIDAAYARLRQVLLDEPAQAVGDWMRFPGPVSSVIGDIAENIPLPIDRPLGSFRTFLEVAGMAVGLAVGVPLLATACLKSYVHDQLKRAVTDGVRTIVDEVLHPAERSEPGPVRRIAAVAPNREPVGETDRWVPQYMEPPEPHPPLPTRDRFDHPFCR